MNDNELEKVQSGAASLETAKLADSRQSFSAVRTQFLLYLNGY